MIAPFDDAYPDVLPWPVTAVFEPILTIAPRERFKCGRA